MQLSVAASSLVLIVAWAVISLLMVAPSTGAVEVESVTDIRVSVCGPPEVDLQEPAFEQNQLSNQFLISGTVKNASQVEIYINGVFDQVIAIATGKTSFTTSISVSRGDLMIEARAIGICGLRQSYDYEEVTNFITNPPDVGDGPSTKVPTANLPVSDSSPSLPQAPKDRLEIEPLKDKSSTLQGSEPKLVPANLGAGLQAIGMHTVIEEGWLRGLSRVVLIISGSFIMALGSTSYLLLMKVFKKPLPNLSSFADISLRFGGLGLFVIGIFL